MMGNIVGTLAIVLKSYVLDGRIVCDCVRAGGGASRWDAVPLLVQGGGPNRGLFIAPTPAVQANNTNAGLVADPAVNEGAQVVICYVMADPLTGPQPYIFGVVGHTGSGLSSTNSVAATADDDADTTVDARAISIQNAGATILEDARGEIALIPTPGGQVRVQLTQGAALRVSSGGNASDYAVLANPAVDRDAVMLAAINELYAAVNRLALFANAQTVPPIPPILIAPTSGIPTLTVSDVAAAVLRLAPDRPLP